MQRVDVSYGYKFDGVDLHCLARDNCTHECYFGATGVT